MKSHRRNQLALVVFVLAAAAGATTFAMMALNENINLFYSPAQVAAGEAPVGQTIRVGGMVVEGSVERSQENLWVKFLAGDMKSAEVEIHYEGSLPDLFREGQGIIARGEFNPNGVFIADEVLAKHDEEYMPPEVAAALADAHQGGQENGSGYGQGYGGADAAASDQHATAPMREMPR